MGALTEPSPSDFDRWENLIDAGADPSLAGRQLGFRGSSAFRRADPQRHADTLERWRDVRDAEDRVLARDTFRQIAASTEAPEAARVSAAAQLAKSSGYTTERVEVTGADGGPVEFEDRSATLADVSRVLVAVGALNADGSVPAQPEVPDTRPVLAEPAAG